MDAINQVLNGSIIDSVGHHTIGKNVSVTGIELMPNSIDVIREVNNSQTFGECIPEDSEVFSLLFDVDVEEETHFVVFDKSGKGVIVRTNYSFPPNYYKVAEL